MKPTKEQILGSFDPAISYEENIHKTREVLVYSGRLPDMSIITSTIAELAWAIISVDSISGKVVITEVEVDKAIERVQQYIKEYG